MSMNFGVIRGLYCKNDSAGVISVRQCDDCGLDVPARPETLWWHFDHAPEQMRDVREAPIQFDASYVWLGHPPIAAHETRILATRIRPDKIAFVPGGAIAAVVASYQQAQRNEADKMRPVVTLPDVKVCPACGRPTSTICEHGGVKHAPQIMPFKRGLELARAWALSLDNERSRSTRTLRHYTYRLEAHLTGHTNKADGEPTSIMYAVH